MHEPKEMATRIKMAAKVHGTKLGDMWKDLGLSNNTLHNMNNGSTPSIGTLMMIAQYLGVPSDYIIGERIEIAPNKKDGSENDGIAEEKLRTILSKMSDSDIDSLLDYAQYLLWKRSQAT